LADALYSSIKLKSIKIRAYNRWYIYLIIIIINAVISDFYPVMESYQAFKIPAGSMKPTLLIGDHIMVNKQAYSNEKPLRGDVVVFKLPKDESKIFIKRIAGIEGDKIQIKKDELYINDERVKTKPFG
jgi:signal peptidase I